MFYGGENAHASAWRNDDVDELKCARAQKYHRVIIIIIMVVLGGVNILHRKRERVYYAVAQQHGR